MQFFDTVCCKTSEYFASSVKNGFCEVGEFLDKKAWLAINFQSIHSTLKVISGLSSGLCAGRWGLSSLNSSTQVFLDRGSVTLKQKRAFGSSSLLPQHFGSLCDEDEVT